MLYLPLPLEPYIDVQDFKPEQYFSKYDILKRRKSKNAIKERFNILDCICAFDIEAYNHDKLQQAIMYIWQFQLDEEITVFGRTWDEFISMLKAIIPCLPERTTLVIYVHNLSYEFQYIKGVYDFTIDEVFATDRRKVLYCTMFENRIELRCSYRLSNMNLKDFTRKYKVKHAKLTDFEYNIPRYWFSDLSIEELRYCQNDVLGLVETIRALLISEQETLLSVPLTSTGFIRKKLKKIVFENLGYTYAKPFFPDPELYSMMRRAYRGGDTHCNRYYVNDILHNISSVDRSSSYPDVLCNGKFPIEPFKLVEQKIDRKYLEKLIFVRDRAILMEVTLTNVRLKNKFWGSPYISRDKSYNIVNGKFFNGRILSAASLTCCLTEIDYIIINETYSFDIDILKWYKSSKGKLPRCIIDFVIEQYKNKTELKGLTGELNETLYMKSKNLLNGIYGLFATNPIHEAIEYLMEDRDFHYDNHTSQDELFKRSLKSYWLPYQFGVYVCALARYELYRGVKIASAGQDSIDNFSDYVYSDTDSVKYIGDVDFSEYNAEKIRNSTESGAFATDAKGKVHYMGVFEVESDHGYTEFKSCGSKKYAYVEDGKLHVTIAGVDKKKGAKELEERGGLKVLEDGFTFYSAGGLAAKYNDFPEIAGINVNGYYVPIVSNLYLYESEYTVGTLQEYKDIITMSKIDIDKIAELLYNDGVLERDE